MSLKSCEEAGFKTEVMLHLGVVNWWNSLAEKLVDPKFAWFEENITQVLAREILQELLSIWKPHLAHVFSGIFKE